MNKPNKLRYHLRIINNGENDLKQIRLCSGFRDQTEKLYLDTSEQNINLLTLLESLFTLPRFVTCITAVAFSLRRTCESYEIQNCSSKPTTNKSYLVSLRGKVSVRALSHKTTHSPLGKHIFHLRSVVLDFMQEDKLLN